jgi:hypothetical protein
MIANGWGSRTDLYIGYIRYIIQTSVNPLPSILAGTVAGRKDLAELVDEI